MFCLLSSCILRTACAVREELSKQATGSARPGSDEKKLGPSTLSAVSSSSSSVQRAASPSALATTASVPTSGWVPNKREKFAHAGSASAVASSSAAAGLADMSDETTIGDTTMSSSNNQSPQLSVPLTLGDIFEALSRGGPRRLPVQIYPDSLGDESDEENKEVLLPD